MEAGGGYWWVVGYSSIATIGIRPPPDDVGRQKGCKVRVARHPTGTMANQATRLGFGRFSRGSLFVVAVAVALPDQ